MFRYLFYLSISIFIFALISAAVLAGGFYYLVMIKPGTEIDEANINDILTRESPVFYRDGTTRLGVLFEDIHRQYLGFEDIPKDFVNALVAAEDDDFFNHHGVDPMGIGRAILVNFKSGKITQGGSTITQQTAKNLFKRESRSLKAKLRELLLAFRLEHKYSKEKIFEFYTNQFFVSGTGHGLGVAARYYFDKEAKDLTLLECAFIAGSVKRPNYYNPFLKKNQEQPELVRERIEERVDYVLGRMVKLGMLSYRDRANTKAKELVFNRGRMGYVQSTAMDLVKEGLGAPFIADILEENGISNISTSGARIITSLDLQIQNKSVYALRRQLSRLDIRLRGYSRGEVQEEYSKLLHYEGEEDYTKGSFVFGTVESLIEVAGKGTQVKVRFGDGITGLLDNSGLESAAEMLAKYRQSAWAKGGAAERKQLVAALVPGDKIYVSVRQVDEQGLRLLDLERYPKVEGAAFVLQEGAIRAMVGGASNLYYNRATTAKRLMGSTFKIFTFAAAMQLGWNPVDMIENRRDVFVFLNRPYFPQPDHNSPFNAVTMSWAGVTSENLAAVWLLYHLSDHLTPPAIREMAVQLDMAPRNEGGVIENYESYAARIRDTFGIRLTRELLEEAAYDSAVKALKPDFLFDNRQDEYQYLARLKYGLYFDRFGKSLPGDSTGNRQRDASLLYPNYLSLRSQLGSFLSYKKALTPTIYLEDSGSEGSGISSGWIARHESGRFMYTTRDTLPEGWIGLSSQEVLAYLDFMGPSEVASFWAQVSIGGVLSAGAMQQVEEQMEIERRKFQVARPYTLEILGEVRDFRVMLSLQYMVHLARECGVNSRFEPVLSMTLGSNVVSLSEMTRLYETMITGFRHDFADAETLAALGEEGRVDPDGPAIIERIETPEGRVVYSREIYKKRVFDEGIAASVASILQNTIPYGTGRYAVEHVRLHSDNPERESALRKLNLRLPLLGKTGTANTYRNAAFMGFVPVLNKDNQDMMTLQGGYTVGVYTGFDDNQVMSRKGTRVTGSVGALPAWSDIAQGLLEVEQTGDRLDLVDMTFNGLPLQYPDVGQIFLPVDSRGGGAVLAGRLGQRQAIAPAGPFSLVIGKMGKGGQVEIERRFLPFWKHKEAK